jgi:hypothetical protein
MAETTADVRRDIELTRERMSTTLQQLEQKLNVMEVVRDNPWPALALAVGAGVLLSGSRSDVKAAAATVAATRGASSRVGSVLDDVVSNLMSGLQEAFDTRVTSLVDDLKSAIGAPTGQRSGRTTSTDVAPRGTAGTGTADAYDGAVGRDSGTVGIQATRAD